MRAPGTSIKCGQVCPAGNHSTVSRQCTRVSWYNARLLSYVTLSKWAYLQTSLNVKQHFKIINFIRFERYCNWFNIYLPSLPKTKPKRRNAQNIIFHIFQMLINASVSLNSTEENWFWTVRCASVGYLKFFFWHRYLVIKNLQSPNTQNLFKINVVIKPEFSKFPKKIKVWSLSSSWCKLSASVDFVSLEEK
jgi:hypothetical protein